MDEWQTLVDAHGLQGALGRDDLVLVDCRHDLSDPRAGRDAWARGHLPAAVHAHLDHDLSAPGPAAAGRHPLPDPESFRRFLSSAGIGPQTQVVAYDAGSGAMAATRLWWLLQAVGHRRAAVLDGGLAHWQSLGLATSSGDQAPRPGDYPPLRLDPALLAEAGELAERVDEEPGWLVDARAAPRFRGEVEPIDPVAGHVPGAVNRPFTDNLAPDGLFKAATDLHGEWQSIIGTRSPREVVVMCGSGVTASHHLLAMHHAGLAGARLYAPSWSGWVAVSSRPVATGR